MHQMCFAAAHSSAGIARKSYPHRSLDRPMSPDFHLPEWQQKLPDSLAPFSHVSAVAGHSGSRHHGMVSPRSPPFHLPGSQQKKLVLEGNGPGRHHHPKNESLVAAISAIKHSLPNVAQVFKNGCISLVVLAKRPAKYSLQRILWHSATRVSKSRAFPRKVMPGGHITS